MVGQKVGNEIDQSSCIWRMNNAPTKGYEEDVGRMTMIRVVSHTSVPLLLKNPDYFFKEANATIYVIWGPFRNMRKDGNGIVYNMLKKTVDIYPNAQIYVTTEKRMSYCDGVFKKETGKDRNRTIWPANGERAWRILHWKVSYISPEVVCRLHPHSIRQAQSRGLVEVSSVVWCPSRKRTRDW
uniref:alpha-N-acetylgalactosaminide alpha-2,6-sialyltransferase 3 isoform X2 n=1 Tax=Halichoerus grypus TaxID=9711 RepID=UPI001659B317|nr:alpha-N-acetylgalactosaminide alpha-2,6-sialyltransferase 3 isoform X2 [Halichoerus grypus]